MANPATLAGSMKNFEREWGSHQREAPSQDKTGVPFVVVDVSRIRHS